MKKFLISVILLLCAVSAFAQRPFMRDTIWHTEPTYYYEYWLDSLDIKYLHTTDSCETTIYQGLSTYELAKYNYTDSALKVVGVAAIVYSPTPNPRHVIDTSYANWYEYMRLYKNTDTGLVTLAEGTFTVKDTARWMRLYKMDKDRVVGKTYPVCEVYFDHPVTVTDSFYVTVTDYHSYMPNHYSGPTIGPTCWPVYYLPLGAVDVSYWPADCYNQRSLCQVFHDSLWYYCMDNCIDFVFPIIDTTQPLPDTCAAVTHLVADVADSTTQLLSWVRGRYNLAWEVACGPADSSAAWAVQPSDTTSATLTGLVHGREYAACVRALCADSVHYSDWGDTIRFLAGHTEGIRHAAPPLGFTLSPNPASGEVTIQGLGEVPQTIEVLDMTGRTAASFRRTAAIDISALPAGSYIVRVQTADGQVQHQKLVKQ